MIHYRIAPSHPHAHRFEVALTIKKPPATLQVSMPVWIPGSYLVREFARHLSGLQATQGGQPCPLTQLDKTTWQLAPVGRGDLVLRYEVYAFDTSVRAAFLDAQRGFFNGTSVFMRVEGLADQRHQVHIEGLPKGWSVATALPALKVDKSGQGLYEAADFDELVDHPVEMGVFWRGEFSVRGTLHELVVTGAAATADLPRLLADTQRICEKQITFWHGRRKPPFKRYVFLLHAVEDGYGGLEHRASTALICARKDLPRHGVAHSGEAYTTLLGLISHEYFHTWNVKRLMPREFAPYDYSRENHSQMLWFFEGFTSYYDDLFLRQMGQVDGPNYLKLLAKPVNQVLATPGRHEQSLAQASFDAWTRYYRPDENTANATVSYYTKGSLLALALDLSLREGPAQADGSQPSLDGVMRRLWAHQRPITEADVAQALSDEATQAPRHAPDWPTLLTRWVHGRSDLPLRELLAAHGVQWAERSATIAQRLGLRLQDTPQGLKVQAVMHGSAAQRSGLSAGDELIALNDWRLRRSDDLTLCWHDAGQPEAQGAPHAQKGERAKKANRSQVALKGKAASTAQVALEALPQALVICRDQRVLSLRLCEPCSDGAAPPAPTVSLSLMAAPELEPKAAERRRAWLGC